MRKLPPGLKSGSVAHSLRLPVLDFGHGQALHQNTLAARGLRFQAPYRSSHSLAPRGSCTMCELSLMPMPELICKERQADCCVQVFERSLQARLPLSGHGGPCGSQLAGTMQDHWHMTISTSAPQAPSK